jgi:outer membrane protein OmpA-like peptidoglycan-associated protein
MKRWITVIGAGGLLACTVAAQEYPRVETFLGYTYVHFYPQSNVPSFSANGGRGEFAYNVNRWLAGVFDAGAVTNGSFNGFTIDNTQVFFMAGPRFSYRRSRFKPYAQAVFGGVYYTASVPLQGQLIAPNFGPIFPQPGDVITSRVHTNQTKFALAAGLGLDIKLTRHLSFRPGSVDYYYTRIGNLRDIGDNSQNNIRYSAGLNMLWGGEKPTPPPPPPAKTKTCPDGTVVNIDQTCPKQNLSLSITATPSELCPGESAQVTAMARGADINQLDTTWSVNGQPVSQAKSLVFGTSGRDPGTYTVELKTSGGGKFNPASAQTSITVHEYKPPTGTAQANPAQIYAGDKSTLSANFTGQCGGPIQPPTFTASEGSVRGNEFDSSTVQFDASNNAEQRKTITITAKAADNRSEGTATTTIEVVKKAVVAPVRLPDVLFTPNSARVNNCGKRILLEQLRAYYEKDPTGTVALSGHSSSDEKVANIAEQRAANAAAVITAGTGTCLSIPQSQVQVSSPGTNQNGVSFESGFCGPSVHAGSSTTAEMRRVVVWFIPTGGQIPASMTNYQAASALSIGSLGCPK